MKELKKEKFYLDCIYDNRKSFYKKAYVKKIEMLTGDGLALYSYNTQVCIIYKNFYILNEYSFYSQTTTRHVKEFLKQFLDNTIVKNILEQNNYTKKIIIKYDSYINAREKVLTTFTKNVII